LIEAKKKMQGYILNGKALRINYGKTNEDTSNNSGAPVEVGSLHTPLQDSNYLNIGPPQPPAPHDNKQKDVIDKFALQVVKNGPSFEEVVKEKQKSNVLFDFLNDGGLYSEYYRWKLYDIRRAQKENEANPFQSIIHQRLQAGISPPTNNQPMQQQPQQQQQQQQQLQSNQPPRPGGPLPPHPMGPPIHDQDRSQLSLILDSLIPTKDSIKKGKDFILSLEPYATHVASFMCERLLRTPDWSAKLNIIYLTNDVLHHRYIIASTPSPPLPLPLPLSLLIVIVQR
jgi:hypothetical protein